jgi:multiple sugar transport system permease protein
MTVKNKYDKRNTAVIGILNAVFLILVLFPFFWLITASIKPDEYIISRTLYWLPPRITFDHYQKVFMFGNLGRIFLNSVIVSVSTVGLSLIVIVPAAYALAILKPKGKTVISKFILSLQMLPGILLIIPLYMVMQKLHLVNTYRSLIISYTTFTIPFCFLLLSSYYGGLPIELFESAYMDGCNSFQSLFRIALPLTAPGLVTTGAYSFLNAWNDFLFSNTFTSSASSRTLTVEVIRLVGSWGTRWGDLAAGATVTVVPVILVFLLANKYIISGLTAGAVKG